MESLTSFCGFKLNWLDEDRDGEPRYDWHSAAHVFNPFYFTEQGGACACRLCEPHLWTWRPLPSWKERNVSQATLRAEKRFLGFDPEAQFRARVT